MTAAPVVGPFDPGHDREPKLLASEPAAGVEHVLLQQREETLIAALSPADATLPIEPCKPCALSAPTNFLDLNWLPRSLWTTQPSVAIRPPRRATALARASTASEAFIRSLIE